MTAKKMAPSMRTPSFKFVHERYVMMIGQLYTEITQLLKMMGDWNAKVRKKVGVVNGYFEFEDRNERGSFSSELRKIWLL